MKMKMNFSTAKKDFLYQKMKSMIHIIIILFMKITQKI